MGTMVFVADWSDIYLLQQFGHAWSHGWRLELFFPPTFWMSTCWKLATGIDGWNT